MYDASDRKHVRRAEKQSKVVEAQRHATLQTLMSTIEGRAWMHDLLFGCGVFSTPFTGDDPRTNFNCGVQSVGLRHFGEVVAVCPDYYLLMMREANERTSSDDARRIAPGGHANRADRPDEDSGGLGDGPDYAEADGA